MIHFICQISGSVANYHRMLATVSSDSSSISSPPTSPDNVSGTTNYSQDYYHKKNAKFDHRSTSTQSNKDLLKDIDTDHYKADKKGKEKDIKFYQKILSSTGLDRLSKSASSTGVPKNSVYKDKLKLGHDDATLSQVSSLLKHIIYLKLFKWVAFHLKRIEIFSVIFPLYYIIYNYFWKI